MGGSLLFSACSTSPVQRICNEEFSRYDQRLEEAVARLDPIRTVVKEGNRAIASVTSSLQGQPYSTIEQTWWREWTERQLGDVQNAILDARDVAPGQRTPARQALHSVANQLVMLEGHLPYGDRNVMIRLLENMRVPQAEARKHFCAGPQE